MKLTVNEQRGRFYDIVNTMVLYYSSSSKKLSDDINGEISNIYAFINKELGADAADELELFFSENGNALPLVTNIIPNEQLLYSDPTVGAEKLAQWMRASSDAVLAKTLSYYDRQFQDEKFYYSIISDKDKVFDLVKNMPVSDRSKTHLMMFIFNPKKIFDELEKLIAKSTAVVDQIYEMYRQKYQEFIEKYTADVLTEVLKVCDIDISAYENCELSPSLTAYSDALVHSKEGKAMLILGLDFEQAAYNRMKNRIDIDWRRLGRVLSDEKRIKIIELLRNKELYITEIAKAMGMSVTAVWYHLDILSSEKAIKLRSEGRKVYHSLNDEFFTALARYSSEYCRMLENK